MTDQWRGHAKRIAIIGVAVLVVVTFLAGFWPQHRPLTESQDQVRSRQERLTAAETRVRLGDTDAGLESIRRQHEEALRRALGYPTRGASLDPLSMSRLWVITLFSSAPIRIARLDM